MASLYLNIVTPEKQIFSAEVDQVNIPTPSGEIGVLPHHANLMSKVAPGELRIFKDSKVQVMAIGSGLLQMAGNKLSIMTDLAEKAEDIDEKAVEQAKARAEEALEQKLGDEEYATAMANLEKALAQLRVKRRIHSR